jgi:hypothetical protein
VILAALPLLLPSQASPVPGPPIAVEVVELGPTAGHSSSAFFSGSRLPLTLRVLGAQGRRLDLRVQVLQLAHALAAPLEPALDVAAGAELGPSAWHEFPLALACPALERAVTWELRFLARTRGEDPWEPAGSARLELHPPDLLAPLRALAREQRWFVRDPGGSLKSVLAGARIAFSDLDRPEGRDAWTRGRASRPAAEALVLWVRAKDERDRRADAVLEEAARALLFEDAGLPLTLRLEPGKTRVTLDLATLARLSADPRTCIALVEAVDLTHRDLTD